MPTLNANFYFLFQKIKQFYTKIMFLIENISIVENSADKLKKNSRIHGKNSQKEIC